MVGLEASKFSAIAPAVMLCEVSIINIARLVGSAMAWNMSLLNFIMKLFNYTNIYEAI